jgi:hypothetical protein
MIGKCINNSHLIRNELTIDKEYEVVRVFNDKYAGYPMIDIENDKGETRVYRGDRFILN